MRLHEPQNCVRTFCEQRLPTRRPHQTFANRDPRAVRRGRQVPNRVAGLRQQAPHTNMINRQGVACAPLGQATTMHGCRTPRSSHRRPDNPGTFRAPPSLNVGDHLLRHPEPGQRLCERHTPPTGGPLHHLRPHAVPGMIVDVDGTCDPPSISAACQAGPHASAPVGNTARTASNRCSTTANATSANPGLLSPTTSRNIIDQQVALAAKCQAPTDTRSVKHLPGQDSCCCCQQMPSVAVVDQEPRRARPAARVLASLRASPPPCSGVGQRLVCASS